MLKRTVAERRAGAAAAELAITFPLLLAMLIGLWEVGRYVEVKQLVANAAREGGRQASTGKKTSSQVTADAINYLRWAGLTTTGTNVTLTNLTNPNVSDPSQASQLDQFRITVSLPFDNVKWSLLQKFTQGSKVSATSSWYSMNDVPVSVSETIPVE